MARPHAGTIALVVLLILSPAVAVAAQDRPTPEPLYDKGAFRVDPTIFMVSGRHAYDSPADEGEIEPFRDGKVLFSAQLAGMDVGFEFGKVRLGINGGFGISEHDDAGLVVGSASFFVQVANVYRIEWGKMHAKSGKEGLTGDQADKTAYFIGVAIPAISDKIRKLLGN